MRRRCGLLGRALLAFALGTSTVVAAEPAAAGHTDIHPCSVTDGSSGIEKRWQEGGTGVYLIFRLTGRIDCPEQMVAGDVSMESVRHLPSYYPGAECESIGDVLRFAVQWDDGEMTYGDVRPVDDHLVPLEHAHRAIVGVGNTDYYFDGRFPGHEVEFAYSLTSRSSCWTGSGAGTLVFGFP